MITYNVELNHKENKEGNHLLILRLTKDRKHKRVALGRYIKMYHFNPEAKYGLWVRSSCLQHKEINEMIKSLINQYQAKETEFIKRGKLPTLFQVLTEKNPSARVSFPEFAKKEVERHNNHGQNRTGVKKGHLISKVVSYYGSEDVMFEDITVSFLKGYENYWTLKGNQINTIQTDFKGLRAIIRSAVMEGIISSEENPFNKYRIKSAKTYRDKLTEEEIKKLEKIELTTDSREWHARNMFVLSFYCAGIRFGDLLQLKWKNIQGDHLNYVMDKTGDPHTVLLTPEAIAILAYYRRSYSRDEVFIFPFLKNDRDYSNYEYLTQQISSANTIVNKGLKSVTEKAGINKKVSFHISRHSFAYMALRRTGDLYGVSKSLNHKRINTTEIYLKDKDPDAADSLMRKIFN